jgi:hypothetical protein
LVGWLLFLSYCALALIHFLPPLREVIRRHGLSARKSLGQNFLLDLNLTARIARAAEPLENITVVEVGPGPGGLTRALLALGARRVVAIERDERALAALAEIAARYPGRLEIVSGDALEVERVVHPASAPALSEEPAGAQGPQVVRHEGRAQPQHLAGIADAVLPVAEEGHDPGAVGLGHGVEGGEDVGRERSGQQVGRMRIHLRHSNRC